MQAQLLLVKRPFQRHASVCRHALENLQGRRLRRRGIGRKNDQSTHHLFFGEKGRGDGDSKAVGFSQGSHVPQTGVREATDLLLSRSDGASFGSLSGRRIIPADLESIQEIGMNVAVGVNTNGTIDFLHADPDQSILESVGQALAN